MIDLNRLLLDGGDLEALERGLVDRIRHNDIDGAKAFSFELVSTRPGRDAWRYQIKRFEALGNKSLEPILADIIDAHYFWESAKDMCWLANHFRWQFIKRLMLDRWTRGEANVLHTRAYNLTISLRNEFMHWCGWMKRAAPPIGTQALTHLCSHMVGLGHGVYHDHLFHPEKIFALTVRSATRSWAQRFLDAFPKDEDFDFMQLAAHQERARKIIAVLNRCRRSGVRDLARVAFKYLESGEVEKFMTAFPELSSMRFAAGISTETIISLEMCRQDVAYYLGAPQIPDAEGSA